MSLRSGVLEPGALRATAEGFELDVRLSWYRSLPLSCVTALELTVDGEPVRDLRAGEHRVDELADRFDDWWFVLDPLTLRAARTVRPGDRAAVELRLGLRIPYIEIGPERFLEVVTDVREELTAR